ncbi:hypothetical protein K438DRAFT_1776918 [Mycena galopus ATCC 62051]|nr:hypothetical protein K438DRAFT_1776918 [Mycena galopus ATCC 62051]
MAKWPNNWKLNQVGIIAIVAAMPPHRRKNQGCAEVPRPTWTHLGLDRLLPRLNQGAPSAKSGCGAALNTPQYQLGQLNSGSGHGTQRSWNGHEPWHSWAQPFQANPAEASRRSSAMSWHIWSPRNGIKTIAPGGWLTLENFGTVSRHINMVSKFSVLKLCKICGEMKLGRPGSKGHDRGQHTWYKFGSPKLSFSRFTTATGPGPSHPTLETTLQSDYAPVQLFALVRNSHKTDLRFAPVFGSLPSRNGGDGDGAINSTHFCQTKFGAGDTVLSRGSPELINSGVKAVYRRKTLKEQYYLEKTNA